MITGVVTADREAMIRIAVRGRSRRRQEVDAVVDTGFNGSLSLPPSLIAQMQLVWKRRGRALLADGSDILFDIYEAVVLWGGSPQRISVDEANSTPLVGMALLENYELTIEVRNAG